MKSKTRTPRPRNWPTLPDDCYLSYIVGHEAWYALVPGNIVDKPEINVCASNTGGGVAWEFSVTEYDQGDHGHPIRVGMFSDSFAAFRQIPWFFEALADGVTTLAQVIAALDAAGAIDETDRERR